MRTVDEGNTDWRPHASIKTLRQRAAMLIATRAFFAEQNVLEVDTPALGCHTVTDPNIESLCSQRRKRFLQTSPEYFMKRMLAAGFPDIYQVCKVFRDGEHGRLHRPEFTMIEWYRLNYGLEDIMHNTVDLASRLLGKLAAASATDYISYRDAFRNNLDIDPLDAEYETLASLAGADDALRQSIGPDKDAWLDLLLCNRIAPRFATDRFTVLHHYPASQAALARRCRKDDRLADRFEIFYGTTELANGFVELRDAEEQLARFNKDQEQRQSAGQDVHEIDMRLIDALRHGLPACAGVAMGLDRLLMIREDLRDIADATSFGC